MSIKVNGPLTNLERAAAAWNGVPPAWVRALAQACDASNQRAVAEVCGFPSHPEVGRIVRREHTGSYAEAEARVRAALKVPDQAAAIASPAPAPAPAPAANLAKAIAAWGTEPPRWVRLLAQACDAGSQGVVAAHLGLSSTVVSRCVNRGYAGSYPEVERQVLAKLGGDRVACPLTHPIDTIPLSQCIRMRRRRDASGPLGAMTAACATCPLNSDLETT